MNGLRILNVGEGDRTLTFDPTKPEELERAKITITEMLRMGFAILVRLGEYDGEPTYRRATGFDPSRNEYIIRDAPPSAPEGQQPSGANKRAQKTTRRVPASDTLAVGVARSAGGMSDSADSIEARNRELQADPFAHVREGLRWGAHLRNQWAGIPMPLPELPLVVEPHYPLASAFESRDEETEPGEYESEAANCRVRNRFFSTRARRNVLIWTDAHGRVGWGFHGGITHFDTDVGSLVASDAWGVAQERRALSTLARLLSKRAFRQYLLTGMFCEHSRRSGICYFFRRLRPTVAVSGSTGDMRILAALCAHPIAYYEGTWAGAMCPTDDVIAHLMMMRGDEPLYWRRCNQHRPYRQEAGL